MNKKSLIIIGVILLLGAIAISVATTQTRETKKEAAATPAKETPVEKDAPTEETPTEETQVQVIKKTEPAPTPPPVAAPTPPPPAPTPTYKPTDSYFKDYLNRVNFTISQGEEYIKEMEKAIADDCWEEQYSKNFIELWDGRIDKEDDEIHNYSNYAGNPDYEDMFKRRKEFKSKWFNVYLDQISVWGVCDAQPSETAN